MRSKTSFFNAAIFKKDLSRFYLLALLYLAAVCMVLPLVLSTSLAAYGRELGYELTMLYTVRSVYDSTQLVTFISFFGAPCAAMAIFSYLYSARSANMMCSLPVRREAMFLSHAAAVFAVVLASNLVAVLLALAVTLPSGLMLGGYLAQWFVITLGQFVLFFGIAVLCAVVTGNILAMPAIYLVVNLAAFAFAAAISSSLNSVLYGVNVSDAFEGVIRFSPVIWFQLGPTYSYVEGYDPLNPSHTDIFYTYGTDLAVYALVGIVFIVAAFLIYRARRMETAGDVVSITCLRPVFKLVFALGVGIVGGYVFFSMFFSYGYGGDPAYRLMGCLALFSVIGYIGGDMLVRRSTRLRSARTLIPAAAIALVLVAGVWCANSDVFGIERYVPASGDVSRAVVQVRGDFVETDDPETIALATVALQGVLDSRAENDAAQQSDVAGWDYSVNFIYYMDDGSIVERRYEMYLDEAGEPTGATVLLDEIMNSPESIIARNVGDTVIDERTVASGYIEYYSEELESYTQITLGPGEALELYNDCLMPDMLDGSIGRAEFGAFEREYYTCSIAIYVYDTAEPAAPYAATEDVSYPYEEAVEESTYRALYLEVPVSAERTCAWLAEHGVAPDTQLYKYVG